MHGLAFATDLIAALRKDNFEGAFHDHTDLIVTLLLSNNCCLTLSLWAEWNDTLKFALSLSI